MTKPPVFSLDSSQCELLILFEEADTLAQMAERAGRDVSVISRQLQRLAETAPVLEKYKGRWRMTELGRQVNRWSRSAIAEQGRILKQHAIRFTETALPSWADEAALLVLGVQKGFDDPVWGERNNPKAEERIRELLGAWRKAGKTIIHVKHESRLPHSPLRSDAPGSALKPFAEPRGGEVLLRKSANSAFAGTSLAESLREKGISTVVLVGFTTHHCVDATARQASDLGFRVYVVSDATAAFERTGPDGRRFAAADVHAMVLANLHLEFGVVVEAADLLQPPHSVEIT